METKQIISVYPLSFQAFSYQIDCNRAEGQWPMGFDKALLDHDFCKSILYFIPFRTVLYIGYVDFSSFVEIMRSKLPNNDEMGLFY